MTVTVQHFIDAIKEKTGITLPETTVDRLIVGNPNAKITGVATTFMATVDVIRKAADEGINLIITHEPTFFTSTDNAEWAQNDEVYQEKVKLIEATAMNIWRFHDYMHFIQPDLIYAGMIKELGFEQYMDQDNPKFFNLPAWNISQLADHLKDKLQMPTIRLVGSENTVCNRLGFLVGASSLGVGFGGEEVHMKLMQEANLDVLLCGEMLEWTTCAYTRDAGMLNVNRAMLILGHNRSEEGGMKNLVDWLQPLSPSVKVSFIEAGEPFTYL